jgi:hypothetical protein
MSGFTVPVSMIAPGRAGALVAGILGLLIVLALAAQRDPTASNQTVKR